LCCTASKTHALLIPEFHVDETFCQVRISFAVERTVANTTWFLCPYLTSFTPPVCFSQQGENDGGQGKCTYKNPFANRRRHASLSVPEIFLTVWHKTEPGPR